MKTFEIRRPNERDWAHADSDWVLAIITTHGDHFRQTEIFELTEADSEALAVAVAKWLRDDE